MIFWGTKATSHYAPVKAIFSLSKRQVTTSGEPVLNKCLNFAKIIKAIPCLDLIPSV